MSSERESTKRRVPEFQKHGAKLDRAVDAALSGSVKEAVFLPSGRRIVTVVGKMGDEFVDPGVPYCSCSNFYFRVLGGREDVCYHILGYEVASRVGKVDRIEFSDEEYGVYFAATVRDVLDVLRKSASL